MKTKILLITIGLDLGDMKHAICVLNQDGEIIDERTITNHRESLRRLSQKHPGARIAFEVGSNSQWIKRFLAELGATRNPTTQRPEQVRMEARFPALTCLCMGRLPPTPRRADARSPAYSSPFNLRPGASHLPSPQGRRGESLRKS